MKKLIPMPDADNVMMLFEENVICIDGVWHDIIIDNGIQPLYEV